MDETTEPTREWIEKRIAQLEGLLRGPEPAVGWEMDLAVYRMALRTLDAEAQLDHARRRIDAFTARDNAADETIAVLTRQLAAMTERAERAEASLGRLANAAVDALRMTVDILETDARATRDTAMTHAGEFMHAGETAAPAIERMATALREATERADRLQRHFDEAAPEHNLPALLDLYAERERAATERAEKAERLSATLRAVAEQEVADAIVKSRERATRVGWIDHATGDYEERAVTMLMDDLAAGSAVCAFLRMVGVWTLEDRAEKAERERDAASFDAEAQKIRARTAEERLAEVELDRDEEGRLRTEWGALYTDMVRQRDDWHEAAHAADERAAVSSELREAAEAERDALRAKLADLRVRLAEVERERDEARSRIVEQIKKSLPHAMENAKAVYKYDGNESRARAMAVLIVDEALQRLHFDDMQEYIRAKLADAELRVASATQDAPAPTKDERLYALAESPTTHTRCEVIFQRKRADWWRSEAKRLGWTPDYPELRKDPPSDARIDCESSSLLLLSTWARKVMMRPKNRAKGVPSESVEELIAMAREELFEASDAIHAGAPTDGILAELGDAAAYIAFAMRETEKRRKA